MRRWTNGIKLTALVLTFREEEKDIKEVTEVRGLDECHGFQSRGSLGRSWDLCVEILKKNQ